MIIVQLSCLFFKESDQYEKINSIINTMMIVKHFIYPCDTCNQEGVSELVCILF